jgi:hypothetical protein
MGLTIGDQAVAFGDGTQDAGGSSAGEVALRGSEGAVGLLSGCGGGGQPRLERFRIELVRVEVEAAKLGLGEAPEDQWRWQRAPVRGTADRKPHCTPPPDGERELPENATPQPQLVRAG